MIRSREANHRGDRAMAICLLLSLLVSLAAVVAFHHADAHASVYSLSNLVGPAAQSLLHGKGLTVVTDGMGTPGHPITFHAARMPLPSTVVALGALLLGEQSMRLVALLKAVLLLCPVWLSMFLVFRVARWSTHGMQVFAVLLLLPFGSMPFLADVVNLQVEEGYTYSLLAFAVALVLFLPPVKLGARLTAGAVLATCALGVTLDLLFLSKSAMVLAVAVITACFLVRNRAPALQGALLGLVALALGGWAVHQHTASGRYSLGTSLDGINLHKGNNAEFGRRYPPVPGSSLDAFDAELNQDQVFHDEWAFDDGNRRAAMVYMQQHRAETARNDVKKARVFFVSLTRYGSGTSRGTTFLAETLGLVLFRLGLLTAIVVAALGVVTRGGPGRFAGAAFLLVTTACALPYIAGFAYTRHASVLLYPAVLLLCRAMLSEADIAA